MNLSVCLTSRDRPILTQKTIESLHTYSSIFDEIDIYVFDNLSIVNEERFSIFSSLLKDKKIKYYSYDTKTSLTHCFGKSVIFERWLHMVQIDSKIKKAKNINDNRYYLLIDNDMIVGPNWDQYFICASEFVEKSNTEKMIHFLVKYPGGIPTANRNNDSKKYEIYNRFSGDKSEMFDLVVAGSGGGSGFWFMSERQVILLKSFWNHDLISLTHKQFKKHDVNTWFAIRKRFGIIKYVGAVVPNEETPLVLHLGGLVGSMCNILNRQNTGEKEYQDEKVAMLEKEMEFKNLSLKEIINKFKKTKSATDW